MPRPISPSNETNNLDASKPQRYAGSLFEASFHPSYKKQILTALVNTGFMDKNDTELASSVYVACKSSFMFIIQPFIHNGSDQHLYLYICINDISQ